jgi:hypothetical protein
MARWFRFILAILFGLALGLAYGWFLKPVRYVDTSPDTLRIDYKTDYVLMVAEAYQNEKDVQQALQRLALLGDIPPVDLTAQAIQFAQKAGYTEPDVARMQALMSAIQMLAPGQETPGP